MKNKAFCQSALNEIYEALLQEENLGAVATYIPELAKVNPDHFGAYFLSTDGDGLGVGDWQVKFSIQSIAKVLSLSLAYQLLGDQIWQRVGVEPSGNPFNSLVQLETDHGIPRNPFINAGAIVVCDILVSHLADAKRDFLAFVQQICPHSDLQYSEEIARSELSVGYRNIALANFIKSFDNLENEPSEVLDFYFHMCSMEMTCQDLARSFQFLAHEGQHETLLSLTQAKRINAIMQTCGFYDEAGEFSFKVGLPGKSGVGGGIIAINPDSYCLAVWSPRLNAKGNSHRGMQFLERFTTMTQSSIF